MLPAAPQEAEQNDNSMLEQKPSNVLTRGQWSPRECDSILPALK